MIKTLPIKLKITKDRYKAWLEALKPDDLCLYQQFHPKSNQILDSPYEYWEYKAKQFWDLVLELFELSNDYLKIRDKLGYWLSSNLFQTINISDARLIKLPHLKLLFEFFS